MRLAIPPASLPSRSGSLTAWKSRQNAYPASPAVIKTSNISPKGCSPTVARAPLGSVVCPPAPIATASANAPTRAYTAPLVAYPSRPRRSTHEEPKLSVVSFARRSAAHLAPLASRLASSVRHFAAPLTSLARRLACRSPFSSGASDTPRNPPSSHRDFFEKATLCVHSTPCVRSVPELASQHNGDEPRLEKIR